MTRTSPHRDHRRESASQKARSSLRRRGRPEGGRRLASCWRRARFSSANSARVWRAERNVLMRLKSRATIVKQCRESAVTASFNLRYQDRVRLLRVVLDVSGYELSRGGYRDVRREGHGASSCHDLAFAIATCPMDFNP